MQANLYALVGLRQRIAVAFLAISTALVALAAPATAQAVDLSKLRDAATPYVGAAAAAAFASIAIPGFVSGLLYLALNAANRRLSRPATDATLLGLLDRLLDRLCITTRQGAINRWSVPLLGKSLFDTVVEFVRDEVTGRHSVVAEPPSENEKPDSKSEPGYTTIGALRAIVVLLIVAGASLFAIDCRLPDPDGCEPYTTRCSPEGVPQVCSASQRWTQSMSEACPSGSVCGAAMVHGRRRHVCTRPEDVIPDEDSGVDGEGGG